MHLKRFVASSALVGPFVVYSNAFIVQRCNEFCWRQRERERECVCVCVCMCLCVCVRARARVLSAAAFVRAGGAIRDSDYPLTPSHASLSVQRRVLFHHPTSKPSDTYFINCV